MNPSGPDDAPRSDLSRLRYLSAGWFLAVYVLFVTTIVLFTLLQPRVLYLMILAIGPVLYAAFTYPRWVYRVMILLALVVDLTAAWLVVKDLGGTLLLILLVALPVTGLAEMSYNLVRRRAAAERALQESEERYRSFVTRLQGIAFQYRITSTGYTFIHGQMQEITGYPADDFLQGRISALQLLHPEDRSRLADELDRLHTVPGYTFDQQYRIYTREGRLVWVHEVSQNVCGTGGRPVFVQGNLFDVTRQKETEEALRESEARFRSLFESLQEGFALYEIVRETPESSLDFRFLAVNPVFEQMFHVAGQSLIGKTLSQVFPNIGPNWLDDLNEVVRTGQPRRTEGFSTVIGRDVEIIIFLPRPGQVAVITADISGRKMVERALRESQAHFRSLFENSPVSLWDEDFSHVKTLVDELLASGVKDLRAYLHENPEELLRLTAALIVNDVNRASLALLGVKSKEEIFTRLNNVLGRVISDAMVEEMCAVAEGRTYFQWEGINDMMDGKPRYHRVTWSVAPGSEESYKRVIVAIDDITESKRTEEALLYLSSHDAQTGIYNRSFFDAEMARLENSRGYPISILFADMDGLKDTNDELGHAVGDDLLRRAAQVLRDSFRSEDVVARIGGDEFGVLLPGVDAEAAAHALERVRRILAAHNRSFPDLPPVRFSIGFATGQPGDSLPEVLRRADERMYQDKATRRQ